MKKHKRATCPSCQHKVRFAAAGEQHWPAAVAAKRGLPPVIQLWECPKCHTTLSDPELSRKQ